MCTFGSCSIPLLAPARRFFCVFCLCMLLLHSACPSSSRVGSGIQTGSHRSESAVTVVLGRSLPYSAARLEQGIHDATNQERKRRGLALLQWDSSLQRVARSHSLDMGQHQFFSHVNQRGESPIQRGNRFGVPCRRLVKAGIFRTGIAENLFQNHVYSAIIYSSYAGGMRKQYRWSSFSSIVATTIHGWMESPPHRRNLLSTLYTHGGVGVWITPDGKIYITHNFC